MPDLTHEDIAALSAIKDGADVFDYRIARVLRRLQRSHPTLLDIGPTPREYGPHDTHPYFGAILTDEGRSTIEEIEARHIGADAELS